MAAFDLLLKNAWVEDPASGVSGPRDIGIAGGRIAAVAEDLPGATANETLDLAGLCAIPGLIDLHVHVSGVFGSNIGFPMLVRAGVCTALNLAGPTTQMVEALDDACGLNLGGLEDASPGKAFDGPDPGATEMERFIDKALAAGALGVKILGGHHPLTPEASARLVKLVRRRGAYLAWHAGTTSSGSNIEGLRECVELADGELIHLAHVNSYCRGLIREELAEVQEALEILKSHPNVFSESYLAAMNGTSLAIGPDDKAASRATGANLKFLGFADSRAGMAAAIRAGVVHVLVPRPGDVVRLSGEEGLAVWEKAGSRVPGSIDINPPASRLALFLARRAAGGDFTVDALATDGGTIPRNVMLASGLALVAGGFISLSDFVRKASYNPSRLLGLAGKGHLGLGADADVTVADLERRQAVHSIIGGRICLHRGQVCGRGGLLLTTPRGVAALRESNVPYRLLEAETPLPISAQRTWSPVGRS